MKKYLLALIVACVLLTGCDAAKKILGDAPAKTPTGVVIQDPVTGKPAKAGPDGKPIEDPETGGFETVEEGYGQKAVGLARILGSLGVPFADTAAGALELGLGGYAAYALRRRRKDKGALDVEDRKNSATYQAVEAMEDAKEVIMEKLKDGVDVSDVPAILAEVQKLGAPTMKAYHKIHGVLDDVKAEINDKKAKKELKV